MNNQFDITKHKWSDDEINYPILDDNTLEIWHEGQYKCSESISLNKIDTIAIAKHFYEQLSAVDRLMFITSITGVINAQSLGAIPDQAWGESTTKLNCEKQSLYLFGESTTEMDEGAKKAFKRIPQSETTYKTLNLDTVGEISNNELFNKEGDLHG